MIDKNTEDILPIFKDTLFVNIQDQKNTAVEGEFLQKIILFTSTNDYTEGTKTMLQNMLKACNLTIADCYLFTIDNANNTVQIINQCLPTYVLSFGINIANDMFQLAPLLYQIQEMAGIKMVLADNLLALENNAKLKQQLWNNVLKPIFVSSKN